MGRTETTRYWMNVVSNEHVKIGVQLGITQSCHGKAAPLKRMCQGDWIIHYSAKEIFQGKELCQKFTSIGEVVDGEIYQVEMGEDFIPWRRNIRYLNGNSISIFPLLNQLSFTKDRGKNWGVVFRYGFFEIKKEDFELIHKEMMKNKINTKP